MLAACCTGLVSACGLCSLLELFGADSVAEASHRGEQFSVDVVAVARPVAAFDVIADCFEQIRLIQVADLYDVGRSADVDGVGLESNDAALSVEAICGELVHGVCFVLIESSCLPLSFNTLEHDAAPDGPDVTISDVVFFILNKVVLVDSQ